MFNVVSKNIEKITIISIFFCVLLFSQNVFADEDNITYKIQSEDNTNLSEEELKSKEERLNVINECINELKKNLSDITKSFEVIRSQKEYETYPAIRLNVDTPLFGLISIVNNKLKITSEVSTIDVATGFSIKDVVRQNNIKVPSLSVGSLVVLTRDVKLDKDITISDADTAILYLFKYIKQTENVKDFLDNQINKIFVEYIPKEKKDKIDETNKRLDSLNQTLLNLDDKIVSINLLYSDNENYSSYISDYKKMSDNIYDLKTKLKNILISDSDLQQIQKSCANLEASIIDFSEKTDTIYVEITANVDLIKMFKNVKKELHNTRDLIKSYIDNSYVKSSDNTKSDTDENNEVNKTQTQNQEKIYSVISTESLENINDDISKIDEMIIKYIPSDSYITEIPEEVINRTDVINVENQGELTAKDKVDILNKVTSIYKDVLQIKYQFFINNIDNLLQDSTNKINDIIKYSDESSLKDIRYVYIDLPKEINSILSKTNTGYSIKTMDLNNTLKSEYDKLLQLNINISNIYKEKNKNNEINSDRQ